MTAQSVMTRMVRPAAGVSSAAQSPAGRQWRKCLPRISESAIGLVATVEGYSTTLQALGDILKEWDRFVMAMVLDAGDGVRGLAFVDAETRAALIEVQTMGRVAKVPPSDRPATEVDAALVRHVIDAWTSAQRAEAGTYLVWTCGALVPDARMAGLKFDEGEYAVEELTIAFGGGMRHGTIRLVRPEGMEEIPGADEGEPQDRQTLLQVETGLEVILYRAEVSLTRFLGLQEGDLIEIPASVLGNVRVEDEDGHLVARGRLGQSRGQKAVRIGAAEMSEPSMEEVGMSRTPTPMAAPMEPMAMAEPMEPMAMASPMEPMPMAEPAALSGGDEPMPMAPLGIAIDDLGMEPGEAD